MANNSINKISSTTTSKPASLDSIPYFDIQIKTSNLINNNNKNKNINDLNYENNIVQQTKSLIAKVRPKWNLESLKFKVKIFFLQTQMS